MSDTATPTLLEDLRAKRADLDKRWSDLIDAREAARAEFEAIEEPTDEQRADEEKAELDFRAACEDLEGQLAPLDERIGQQERKEQRKANQTVQAEVVTEPAVYNKFNAHERSYFKDLVVTNRQLSDHAPRGAAERIERHGRESQKRMEEQEARAQREAERQIEQAEHEFRASFPSEKRVELENPFERRVNPSRETGKGGEFVPPLWLVEDDFIPQLRAGRVVAPLCRNMPVPAGTDTIKLPKVKVGTEVAPQTMDNAGVASRDVETTYVEAAVKTLAGQEDVAIQLIEQSPGQVFDRVVQEDLLADYNLKFEQAVIFGKGENFTTLNAGTIKGLMPAANWGAGTRESTKTLAEYPLGPITGLNANWSHIAKERFNTQNVHHIINPAFGAWLSSVTDGTEGEKTGRLLLEASSIPSYNAAAITPPDNQAEGYFGRTALGPNIYMTANLPPVMNQATTTEELTKILFGVSKNAKEIITSGSEVFSVGLTAKFDDVWVFESDLRTRVLPEVLSGTLQIRFQVYNYVALLVRYSPSLQFCGGTPFKVGTSFSAAPTEPALGGYKF